MTHLVLFYSAFAEKARSRSVDQVGTHDDGIVLNQENKTFIHNIFEKDSTGKRTGNILKTLDGEFKEYSTKNEADLVKEGVNQYRKQLLKPLEPVKKLMEQMFG